MKSDDKGEEADVSVSEETPMQTMWEGHSFLTGDLATNYMTLFCPVQEDSPNSCILDCIQTAHLALPVSFFCVPATITCLDYLLPVCSDHQCHSLWVCHGRWVSGCSSPSYHFDPTQCHGVPFFKRQEGTNVIFCLNKLMYSFYLEQGGREEGREEGVSVRRRRDSDMTRGRREGRRKEGREAYQPVS